jgi:CRP-like cAMP-binding protein
MEVDRTVQYEDGEFILLEGGESEQSLYVVLEGQVKVTKQTDRGQVTLALLEEGEILGEVSFLAQKHSTRSASAVAIGQVKLGILDYAKLLEEHEKLSGLFQEMLRNLSERFNKTTMLAAGLAARRMAQPHLEHREAKGSLIERLRIRVDYVADAKVGTGSLTGLETHKALLLDLAKTGLGLELFTASYGESTHPLGAKFVFQFTLPGKPLIRVPGHIVWARALGGKKARLGIKFSEPNPYFSKVIEEFFQTVADL